MMKAALLVAFTANVLLFVSVQGTPNHKPTSDSESSSSSYSSSSSSLSSSSSNASSSSSSHSSSNNNSNCGNKKCPGPNEVYDECPAPCPPRRCDVDDRLIRCKAPPKIGDPECEPGCRCSDNYYRNDKGICVLREQCPNNNGTCKHNEVYDLCPAKCPFRTCGIDDNLIDCIPSPNVGDPDCPPPACRCANGFFRDDQGNCVEWDKCPKCNNPNEEYDACPAPCPPRECGVDPSVILCLVPPKLGDPECKPGCRCSDNYVRNDEGICIPKEQCPNKSVCEQNEIFSNCTQAICRHLNCTQKGGPIVCAGIAEGSCIEGCVCAPDYLRNSDGNCVPEDQCDELICGQNEVLSECPEAICRPQHCTQKGRPFPCASIAAGSCIKGCVCAPDYLRTSDGNCIPEDQCDEPIPEPACEQNEVYSNCTHAICRHQDCTQKGGPIVCAGIAEGSCIEGCVCAPDYLRNSDGNCVPEDQCVATVSCGGDPNAKPGCGVNCGRLCSNYKNGNDVVCPAICKVNGCDCKEGYVLNTDTNLCVLPEQCPKPEDECNRPNEEYQKCPNCSPGTCESIGKNYHCPLQNATNCKGACRCKPGYYYNKIGDCITKDQCLQCTGKNEFYSCGSACDNVCATLDKQNRTNCPIINIKCNEKCYCEDGYARDENNVCVPVDECKPVTCTKPNEEYQECANCSPGTCESIGKSYSCPAVCIGACRCKPGYYYNKIGECITEEQCLRCNGTNEFYSCGQECDNVCADLDKQNRTNCPIINVKCNEKCYCEDGYARDENNNCVPVDQCKPKCTKPNEEYRECANCNPGTCDSIGKSYRCPAVCIRACRCKPGYFYDKNGDCIPKEECTSCGGDPNAKPGCGTNCGKLCSNKGKPGTGVACSHACSVNGCDCKDGYLYDTNTGKCVKPSDCTLPCGKNEQYSDCVNGGCDKRLCSQIDKPDICIDPIKCEGGCICRDGYLRDENGDCIPKKKCPKPPKCPVNEEFVDCLEGVCRIQDCSQKGQGIACAAVVPEVCTKGCLCSEGFLRNCNGTCVPEDQCEAPKCLVNEEYTKCKEGVCRIQDCSQKGQEISCAAVEPEVCTEGCLCCKGYLRNSNGKCVPEDKCEAPKCLVNEEFSKCIEGVCRIQDCSQKGQEIACAAVVPEVCTEGCLCSKGNLRNSNGKCVPEDQCEVCPEGERFSNCPPVYSKDCNSEFCPKSRYDPPTCPTTRQCGKPKCVCGYLDKRNRKTGKCVRASDCPPFKCDGPNEEYQSCPAGCPGESCTDYLENTQCPKYKIGIVVPCKPACRCLKGFYRNSEGICVESSKCTECGNKNKKNEK